MHTINEIEEWADHHHPRWIDYIRIVLGIVLIIKGVSYIENKEEVYIMLRNSNIEFLSFLIVHYIIMVYIGGGIAIAAGLITRVAALLEMPILVGAIIFMDIHKSLFFLNAHLGYAILILTFLIFFFIYGSGPLSLDNYLMKKEK